MKIVTVCYPLRNENGSLQILLGRKGDTKSAQKLLMVDLWNGGGGKFEPELDQSILHCHQRETAEDFGITLDLERIVIVGKIAIRNPDATEDIELNLAFCDRWSGEIAESSREMSETRWFDLYDLPYGEMMDFDRLIQSLQVLYSCYNDAQILVTRVEHRIEGDRMKVDKLGPTSFEPASALIA